MQLLFTKRMWPKLGVYHMHMLHTWLCVGACVTQIPPAQGKLGLKLVLVLYLLLTDTLRGALISLGDCCNCLFMAIRYIWSSLPSLDF